MSKVHITGKYDVPKSEQNVINKPNLIVTSVSVVCSRESYGKYFEIFRKRPRVGSPAEISNEVFFRLSGYIPECAHSSGQFKGEVGIALEKPNAAVSVSVFAEVHTSSTNGQPFVEMPTSAAVSEFTSQPGKLTECRQILLFNLESGEDEHSFTFDVTYAKVTKECHVIIVIMTTTKANHETAKKSSLVSHIGSLLDKPLNSDVTLKANGQEWPVHKCILSARSPVFAAMFNGSLMESTAHSVDIKDVDSDALGLMIQYIYKSGVDDMKNLEMELLRLADRYDLSDLKKDCEVKLISKLNVDNCLCILLFGMKFNVESLVEKAKSFITKKFLLVCRTEEWKQFANENVNLSVELTVAYSRTVSLG